MRHLVRPGWRGFLLTLLVALFALAYPSAAPAAAHAALPAISTSIPINDAGSGRPFDGVGALSGGGGHSRLRYDYPEPYRSQILDYLFKPGYGADVQILKVEVGGDTNSTDGSESSYMHTATTTEWSNGYEWWLMQQAKLRNPNIKLYGLAWGAPGWIGTTGAPVFDSSHPFWSQDMVNYYVNWIKGAKTHYNLTIDYIGGWNERGYNKQFYEALHSALQSNGLATQIVAADSDWSVADAMVGDSTFNSSINIVGTHYPCGYLSDGSTCNSTANAQSLNKPLWASENGSEDYNSGAAAMARAINRGYLDGKMTAYINWPIVAAVYPNLPYNTDGLILANEPWSGAYSVGKQAWVEAQTTQFTQPGWRYIDSASGYLGGSKSNGSYVTLRSPTTSDYSTVIETMDATAAQTVTISPTNGASTGAAHIWATNLLSNNPANYFVHVGDATPSNGSYSVTLQPGYVYTISTTTGQGKGTVVGPPHAALGLPYADNFEGEAIQSDATYFADQNGSFEIQACTGSHTGQCLTQMAPKAPITWDGGGDPYTIMGDLAWTNYTISVDAQMEQSGYVEVMGRVGAQKGFSPAAINADYFRVTDGGAWSIVRNSSSGALTTLASGTVAALGTNSWHTLSLTFSGSAITAQIDHTTVGSVTDASYSAGQVGLASGYESAQFDNFSITSTAPVPSTYYEVVNRFSGKALDVAGASTANGALIVQNTTSGATSQQWRLVADGNGYLTLINHNSGAALDVPGSSTTQGTQLDQWAATGGANQQWQFQDAGGGYYTIVSHSNGLLVDDANQSTANGNPIIQWANNGGSNQQWSLVPVPTTGVTYELLNVNSGKVMDVNGASTATGASIIQYDDHQGANQQWTLVDAGGGYFYLQNVNSGLVLDVPGQVKTAGVQLDQWTLNDGANQQWQFTAVSGGAFTITSRNSGLVVDVSGASTANVAAVIQASATSGASQQWELLPV